MTAAERVVEGTQGGPQTLAQREAIIASGLKSFIEVGTALIGVRNDRQYREAGYATFDAYCEEKWQLSYRHVNRVIEAAQVVERLRELGPIGPIPANEGQVRALGGLEPQQAAQVMAEAASAGLVTAASIKTARDKVAPQPEPVAKVTETTKTETYVNTDTGEILAPPPTPAKVVGLDGKRYTRPEPKPRSEEWTDQRQAEDVSAGFALQVNSLFAYGDNPDRRRYLIEQWRRGQEGVSPPQRAHVTPENFRLIAAAFTALAAEWSIA